MGEGNIIKSLILLFMSSYSFIYQQETFFLVTYMEACNDSDVNRNVLIESAAEHHVADCGARCDPVRTEG